MTLINLPHDSYQTLKRLNLTIKLNPSRMAGQEGIEPPTYGFGDRRSAN